MRKNHIITLSRQFGSGGGEIGQELAGLLNLRYIDKSIISTAAEKSGISKELFERADEKRNGVFNGSSADLNYTGGVMSFKPGEIVSEDRLFAYTASVIYEFAAKGNCIIVGRCADNILSESGAVRIYLYSDLEDRVRRISRLYEISENAAERLISKTDKRRSNYYNYYTGKIWGAASNYDICLNTSVLRKQGTIDLLKQFVEKIDNAD